MSRTKKFASFVPFTDGIVNTHTTDQCCLMKTHIKAEKKKHMSNQSNTRSNYNNNYVHNDKINSIAEKLVKKPLKCIKK